MKAMNDSKKNRLSGRYDIIEQIGVGGMSYIYKAYDTRERRVVAIKMLKEELAFDDEFVKKFQSEALASKGIRHKNVVSAYDVVDEGSMHYMVLDYAEGITLNKYIADKGRLSNEETVDISLQVARGIRAAHQNGIIHRDIKPQNIIISPDGEAKVTDFGIARAVSSTTRSISVIGTVHYISPEQVRNVKVDYRSDIYSFGCTMYEMITGEMPFEGNTPLEIIVAHLRSNIDNPSTKNKDIYKSLEKIILKATRMVPRERYQTMDEMISDLEMALTDKDGTYIKDNVYDDEEGKTVIITDEDMQVIKAVSEKFTDKSTYGGEKSLTKEQREFIERYVSNSPFRRRNAFRKAIIMTVIGIAFLIVIMVFIALDTRKPMERESVLVGTESITMTEIVKSLEGLNVELAENLVSEYGIKFNVVAEEFSDKYEHGRIIKVVKDNYLTDKTVDLIVSRGSEVLNFSNLDELNNTKWVDMQELLIERDLNYEIEEVFDNSIPRGYIIKVNKNNSKEAGDLIFTVSKGLDASIRLMPSLINRSIAEVRELLEANELLLGNITFVRDPVIPENYVIFQSIQSGSEVSMGTVVDLILSCGPDGIEYAGNSSEKWHSELSDSYRIVTVSEPNSGNESATLILQVRLMQETEDGIVYNELIEPREYKVDAVVPLIFKDIEGEMNVTTGEVQVVDVEKDIVLYTKTITFKP
ncbi:MAG: Stk1 family PASTA domain-containing Ser/Thr kinase [Lachnospiraceae bacterium]|nr:Stk1 family PASTA domain-containing Ser/Thr kinase [Lachnospiraceae bacterium]